MKLLSHAEQHPVSCIVASITGLVGGFANFYHLASEIFGLVSGIGGAVITTATIWGMLKTWAKNRAMRELIANQTPPPPVTPPTTTP